MNDGRSRLARAASSAALERVEVVDVLDPLHVPAVRPGSASSWFSPSKQIAVVPSIVMWLSS